MIKGGPRTTTDGLVFYIDAADKKCIQNPGGCNGYTGSVELLNNVLSPENILSSTFNVRLGNLSYYTAIAITYPEGNYGGDAAARNGVTIGYNVRSGTKLNGGSSRALHLWAYDNDSNTWLDSPYFNGWQVAGHCYDNYSGVGEPTIGNELDQFVADYNAINYQFPNVTFVVLAGHAAEIYNAASRAVIQDLGAPLSFVNTQLSNNSRSEWILVGKPGLGAGNSYAFAYENYGTDPTAVAHLNFGLPIYGNSSNYLLFDGASYSVTSTAVLPAANTSPFTLEAWAMMDSTGNGWQTVIGTKGSYSQIAFNGSSFYYGRNGGGGNINLAGSAGLSANVWYHICQTYNGIGTTAYAYLDGVAVANGDMGTNGVSNDISTLSSYSGTGANEPLIGKIAVAKIYNRALSATEILNNYNAQKVRFGK